MELGRWKGKSDEETWSLEEHFWSQVWRCAHGASCKRCCWPWRKVDLGDTLYATWQLHPSFSDPRLPPPLTVTVGRAAYLIANKTAILPGLVTRHTCHFGPCCNENHVILGTHWDNAQDRRNKPNDGKDYPPVQLPDGRIIHRKDTREAYECWRRNPHKRDAELAERERARLAYIQRQREKNRQRYLALKTATLRLTV